MQTKDNLLSRILDLCKITGDSMYSLAKHSGVSESALSRLKTNSQARMNKKNLILLANYFCVNEDWLATGEGDRDAPGVVQDTLIKDGALCHRFLKIAQRLYGDNDDYINEEMISVNIETMATYTDIPQHRLWLIIYDRHFPSYTEIIQLLKSDRRIDANWLLLGVGSMLKTDMTPKEANTIDSLLKTMSTLQDTISIKSDVIAAQSERIKRLESQLKSK